MMILQISDTLQRYFEVFEQYFITPRSYLSTIFLDGKRERSLRVQMLLEPTYTHLQKMHRVKQEQYEVFFEDIGIFQEIHAILVDLEEIWEPVGVY